MTHTQVNKNKDYKGPTSFRAIIRAIEEDARLDGRDITYDQIDRVLYLFFTTMYGLLAKTSILLEGFARFAKRIVIIKRNPMSKMGRYRIRRSRARKKLHEERIVLAKKHYKKFMLLNQRLRNKGWREWSWEDYCYVHDIFPLIKYKEYVLKSKMKIF